MEVVLSGTMPDVADDQFVVSTNEDWYRSYKLTNNGEAIAFDPNWKLYMQLRDEVGVLIVDASIENGRMLVTDLSVAEFRFQVKQADAAQVQPGSYTYDIILVAGESVSRVRKGTIRVEQGVTVAPGQEGWSHHPLISRP